MKLTSEISAVVTGGASGLGEATARALAHAGVKVGIFDLNQEGGAKVARDIGGVFHPVDITSDGSVEDGFSAVRKINGQERILVNCAGIVMAAKTVTRQREGGGIAHFPLGMFEKVIQVNLIGAFRCLAKSVAGMAAIEPLDEGERGVVVNTASIAAIEGQVGQAAYAASKSGILGLTLPVARDLSSEGIRINAIMPGIMQTPMMEGMSDQVRDSLAAMVPFPRRLGRPAEFAGLVLEICRNAYLNGESIRLDGGIRMMPR